MWVLRYIWEGRFGILLVLAVYIVVWAVIFPFISDCVIFETECSTNAQRSLWPLFGYLETGRFAGLADGSTYTYNPPGYAVILWLLNVQPDSARPFASIIPIQAALYFAIGLGVYAIVKDVWGRFATTALVITVFNPNAMFVVTQPREDTFFSFFIAAAIAAIFGFCRSADWRSVAICGIALGISANFRPTGHYLIYVLPILLPMIALVMKRRSDALSFLRKGLVGAFLGWILVLPWMLHLNSAGESFSLTNYMGKFNWANDFRARLADTENQNMTWKRAIFGKHDDRSRKIELNSFIRRIDPELSLSIPGWAEMTEDQRYEHRFKKAITYLDDFQPRTYVVAALPNLRFTFASGGEGEFFKSFGIHKSLSEWRNDNPVVFASLKIYFIGFSLALKALALLGMVYLILSRRYDLLLFFSGAILYFMFMHIYHGSPRYRLPIEPIFIILAICGLQQIAERFKPMPLSKVP
jgi:hypothetical protein